MIQPGLICAPKPIKQLLPISIGENTRSSLSAKWGVIITFYPIIAFSPIETKYGSFIRSLLTKAPLPILHPRAL